MTRKRLVVLAMSGGVDSSVAALLALERGYRVVGITLRLMPCQDRAGARWCCGAEAEEQARAVAQQLGFPHYVVDGIRHFERHVLRQAWEEYRSGRTPSPCAICNRHLKFGLLRARAIELGAEMMATGHYARVTHHPGGPPRLLRGRDPAKDQSYFLFALSREQLSLCFLPLGDLSKARVRELALEHGLSTARRPSSQDACLVGTKGGFAAGLGQRFGNEPRPGDVVDARGERLGAHPGVHHFTIGQRRGIGVALGRPAWVTRIDPRTRQVEVDTDLSRLMSNGLVAERANWLVEQPAPGEGFECQVQVRYRAPAVEAWLHCLDSSRVQLEFREAQRAVTPGQAVVFYDGERVLGGAWIRSALS